MNIDYAELFQDFYSGSEDRASWEGICYERYGLGIAREALIK